MKPLLYSLSAVMISMFIFSSCSKSSTTPTTTPPSIVGKWELNDDRRVVTDTISGTPVVTTHDSVYTHGKAPIVQFAANNGFTYVNTSTDSVITETGTYSVSNNTLTIMPTSAATTSGTFSVTASTLTFVTRVNQLNVSQVETQTFSRQ